MTTELGRDFSGFPAGKRKQAEERDKLIDKKIAEGTYKKIPPGFLCTNLSEPRPTFDRMPCETVLPTNNGSSNNAYIVFGRDRHTRKAADGYGGRGATSAGMIDIVVGRGGPHKKEGPFDIKTKDGQIIGPNFFTDAAIIYLSQRADIDRYFNLPVDDFGGDSLGRGVKSSQNRSAIGMKADAIRIIGREGVRIFSNPRTKGNNPKEPNSRGGDIQSGGPDRGIHLIANGEIGSIQVPNPNLPPRIGQPFVYKLYKVQPMVKGQNLVLAIEELLHMLTDQTEALQNFMMAQMQFNAQMAFHTHPVASAVPGLAAPDVNTALSWAADTVFSQVVQGQAFLENFKKEIVMDYKAQFLSDTSSFSFLSRYNRVN